LAFTHRLTSILLLLLLFKKLLLTLQELLLWVDREKSWLGRRDAQGAVAIGKLLAFPESEPAWRWCGLAR
jgi:hypothetical protein